MATTQTDQVFELLRAEILSCRLAPSAKIRINDVAARFDVSLGATREALSRLAANGLVVAEAQKGFTVAPVSRKDLIDLTRTRITIEKLCLASAIAHATIEWESALVAACHRLQRISETELDDPSRLNEGWANAHNAFHTALVAACDSPWLLRIREMLFAQSDRYRHLSVPLRRGHRDVNAEHKAILDATIAGDTDKACALLAEHFSETTRILLESAPFAEPDGETGQSDTLAAHG
jgi:DNA-binding GntR family transcriptional regulator